MVIMKTETEASFGYSVVTKGKDKEIPFGYPLMSQKEGTIIRKHPSGIP